MDKLSFRHLLDSAQIKESDVEKLFNLAEKYRAAKDRREFFNPTDARTILSTLFFEPSTRTRFSFESAMYRLNGHVITLEQGESSSISKGESLSDMGRMVSNYCDIVVMRHPKIGSVAEFSKYATVPVINAGDGANQHPTQSLVDLYTIFCEKKKINNLRVGVLGDLKHGRTVHSLLTLLSCYSGNHFTLISHPSLMLDRQKIEVLKQSGCKVEETDNLQEAIKNLDVLYVTRVQQERFKDENEFEKVKNHYHISKSLVEKAKPDLTIMHPLPRINEIDYEVDEMPQARYFAQANYAIYIRMALLFLMTK